MLVALVFALGVALGQALNDNAKPGRNRIFVRTLEPSTLPPVRERREDIAPLARHFVARLAHRFAHPLSLSDDALAWLAQQEWPGNVRELENAIERAAVLSNRENLTPEDFSTAADAPRPTHDARVGTLDEVVTDAEREAITAALKQTNGNRREAAKRLGVSLRTLFYKIDRYGIS